MLLSCLPQHDRSMIAVACGCEPMLLMTMKQDFCLGLQMRMPRWRLALAQARQPCEKSNRVMAG